MTSFLAAPCCIIEPTRVSVEGKPKGLYSTRRTEPSGAGPVFFGILHRSQLAKAASKLRRRRFSDEFDLKRKIIAKSRKRGISRSRSREHQLDPAPRSRSLWGRLSQKLVPKQESRSRLSKCRVSRDLTQKSIVDVAQSSKSRRPSTLQRWLQGNPRLINTSCG